MSTPVTELPLRRVCVWLGEHKIIDHVSEPAAAARFEAAIQRQCTRLRVTSEPAGVEQ
ncbi:hypothetical protein GCM10009804_00920 [Kribbella hippodromi]|uniref:Uncharacterized protein n=1 Tax=Kribbella hippodromi TaxID=434347 RepID=A0ABN2BWV9_9ACTN